MTLEQRIAEIISPTLESMGFELVRVLLSGQTQRKLQIMAERLDGVAMTVDHCADISRAVSALMDVEDPIDDAYTLEVSSPGIDRPLVKLADFERFAGFEARVDMQAAINGQRRFAGRILGVDGDQVLIDGKSGQASLSFAEIAKAKLMMTDDLIAAHQQTEQDQSDDQEQADAAQ